MTIHKVECEKSMFEPIATYRKRCVMFDTKIATVEVGDTLCFVETGSERWLVANVTFIESVSNDWSVASIDKVSL